MPRTAGDSRIGGADRKFVTVDTPVIEYLHEPAGRRRGADRPVHRPPDRRQVDAAGRPGPGAERRCSAYLRTGGGWRSTQTSSRSRSSTLSRPGAITGPVTTSWAMGTRRLYDLVDDDPRFALRADRPRLRSGGDRRAGADGVGDPGVHDRPHRPGLHRDASTATLYGGRVDRPGLPSRRARVTRTAPRSSASPRARRPGGPRSRLELGPGEPVAISRADVRWVVTEYGTAYLFGQSLAERAVALMEIAHPDERRQLLAAAIDRGLVTRRPGAAQPRRLPGRRGAVTCGCATVAGCTCDRRGRRDARRDAGPVLPADRGGRAHPVLPEPQLADRQGRPAPVQRRLRERDGVRRRRRARRARARSSRRAATTSTPPPSLADVAYMVDPDWQGAGLGDAAARAARRLRARARRPRLHCRRAAAQHRHAARLRARRSRVQRQDRRRA